MKRKILSILLAVTVISSLIVGCGQKEADTTVTEKTEITAMSEVTESVETESTESIESTETVETEEQEATETEEASLYSYTDMSATMYAQRAVNVRDLPDTSGNKVGGLSTNQEVTVTGQCNETGWYRISYNGSEAFVSDKYLGESKVEVQQTTQSANTQSSDSQSVSSDSGSTASEELPNNPYPLNTLLNDTGSSVTFYLLAPNGKPDKAEEDSMWLQASNYCFSKEGVTTVTTGSFRGYGPYKEGTVYEYIINYY